MTARIDAFENQFYVRTPYSEEGVRLGRGFPAARWNRNHGAWVAKPYWRNVQYILSSWPDAGWSTAAAQLRDELAAQAHAISAPLDLTLIDAENYRCASNRTPMEHQKRALLMGRDKPYFAYLMEQGTGKTATTIWDAAHNYRKGRIDAVIVIAPNAVKTNWVSWDSTPATPVDEQDEITKYMPDDVPVNKAVFDSDAKAAELRLWRAFEKRLREGQSLSVLAVNYEALRVKRCYDFLVSMCKTMRVMIVLDESTRIKKPGRKRTKLAKSLRKLCPVARILTGTPIVKSPLDAYSQFEFLDESILGFGSYYAFRNHFCNMGGFRGQQVFSYKNLDELADLISPWSFRVTKDQCLDLPAKLPPVLRRLKMEPEQAKAYAEMKEEFLMKHKDGDVEATNVLTQIMRLQQITGGYVTNEGLVIELVPPSRNPKIQDALTVIEESQGQVIVWCRFTEEINAMCQVLEEEKISYRRFDGQVSPEDRLAAKRDLLAGKFKVMVANGDVGGTGQDWYTATANYYVSNSFSTETRVQSEDRTHRKGQVDRVSYYDGVCVGTEDVRVLAVIRGNLKVSDLVMSALEDWL